MWQQQLLNCGKGNSFILSIKHFCDSRSGISLGLSLKGAPKASQGKKMYLLLTHTHWHTHTHTNTHPLMHTHTHTQTNK